MKEVKHKIISVVVAIVLIVLIVAIAFGKQIKESIANGDEINGTWFLALIYPDKYAYSSEQYDLNEYFKLTSGDDVAIILGDERLEDRALYKDNHVYVTLDTVSSLFTKRFYYNENEHNLLYSTASDIYRVDLDSLERSYKYGENVNSVDYVPAVLKGEDVYVALDYVRLFADFEYTFYAEPNRVEIYNKWETYKEATLKKDTNIRYQGGVKSAILTPISEGTKVHVLEQMENWTKIRTEDGYAGYVENDKLIDLKDATKTPVTGAYNPADDYQSVSDLEKVSLAWHQIGFTDDGTNLNTVLLENANINVVSPTWFYLKTEDGTFDNFASAQYVTNAHNKGYKVWGLLEDMTNEVDEYALFSSTASRTTLISNLITATINVGADGINVDCEKIGKQTGPHFVQFLRELSIEAHKNGLVLSCDNYVQNQGNLYYNLNEQGIVCDYVVIMGYDEHWAGSEPGSVASIGFVEKGIQSSLEAGVPASKLINGVPFYTRIWKTEGANQSSEAVGMDTVQEWMNNRGLKPTWDDECCQNYVKYEDGTAVYQIWIEDKDSLDAKMSVMSNNNIAGVAVWKLGFENSQAWEAINSYYSGQ